MTIQVNQWAHRHNDSPRRKPAGPPRSRDWGEVLPCWYECLFEVFSDDVLLREVLGMGVFDEVFGSVQKGGRDSVADDEEFRKKFPILACMMFDTPKIEGKRRQPCTLTIVAEDGMIKGGLRDRDRELSLWVSANGVSEVFVSLEEALTQRPVAWRRSGGNWQKNRQA